jgi:3-oxoacyl-[acyl-carrier protein] reductase
MSKELEGQVVVVTGAARGIGEAVSKQLASMGARVILVARDTKQLDRVKAEIVSNGGDADVIPTDLLDEVSIQQLAQQVENRFHRCDVIVNNAGIGILGKPLHEMFPEEWDHLMGTNLRGPYLMIRAFAPLMIAARSGHIVNISSLAGHNALPNGAAYAASKSGLNGLTYSVAEELRQFNIRVSVVSPGSVNTGFVRSDSTKNPDKKVQPADVARVVAMLVTQSPQSFVSEVLLRPTQKP